MNAKNALDELKWRQDKDLSKAIIHYVHRGAPGDEATISGSEITELESSFFHTDEATIPYHRIFKIDYDGQTIFQRPK